MKADDEMVSWQEQLADDVDRIDRELDRKQDKILVQREVQKGDANNHGGCRRKTTQGC